MDEWSDEFRKVKATSAIEAAEDSLAKGAVSRESAHLLIDDCQDVLAKHLDRKVRSSGTPSNPSCH